MILCRLVYNAVCIPYNSRPYNTAITLVLTVTVLPGTGLQWPFGVREENSYRNEPCMEYQNFLF